MQDRNAFLLHIWHIPSDGEEQRIKEKNRKKTKSSSSSSHGGKVLKCKYEKFYENIFHRFYLRVVVILRWLDYDQGSIDSLIGIVSTVCRHLCMHCIHCMIYIFHFEVTRQLFTEKICKNSMHNAANHALLWMCMMNILYWTSNLNFSSRSGWDSNYMKIPSATNYIVTISTTTKKTDSI